ncbi:MAG: OsmC family protein [Bryobacteraceae bacterium]|nr:OsmC family protein [Bryobacteraceae bacterium]
MKRTATAHWEGGLRDGKGALTTASGVLNGTNYSFHTRFEQGQGTNPEELIAAAHAGCFAMALSKMLGDAGMTAESLDVKAEVTMENLAITASHLILTAKVPGADPAKFEEAAQQAKENCPVSKVLTARVSLDAKLV